MIVFYDIYHLYYKNIFYITRIFLTYKKVQPKNIKNLKRCIIIENTNI